MEENLILEGLLSMVTELKEKQEAHLQFYRNFEISFING